VPFGCPLKGITWPQYGSFFEWSPDNLHADQRPALENPHGLFESR
jgi:hypothetical protein